MAAIDDILNTNNSGYTVTQSQLEAAEVNDAARKQAEAAKKDQMTKGGKSQPAGQTGAGQGTASPASTDFKPAEVRRPVRPSREARMKEWEKANPRPVAKEVPEPEYQHSYNYQDILDQYKKVEEVPEKEAKDQKANESIGAVGDVLTALVNAAGTSNGANNMELDPANGLAENIRKRYEKIRDKQKGDREKYLNLMLKAAQLEDSDNMRKYSLYQQALANADRDNTNRQNAWNRAYDQAEDNLRAADKAEDDQYNKEQDRQQKEEDRKLKEAYQAALLKLKAQSNAETAKHHRVIEAKGGSGSGSGKGKKVEFGNYRSDRSWTTEELKGIKDEMEAAGVFDDLNWLEVNKSKSVGALISHGSKKPAGAKILEKHGFSKIK